MISITGGNKDAVEAEISTALGDFERRIKEILGTYDLPPEPRTCETCGHVPSIRCGCDWAKCGMWAPKPGEHRAPQSADVEMVREAIEALLRRDQRNTCIHENTHRGGVLWEICDQCGMKCADDKGGKPDWEDPKEWAMAENALAALDRIVGKE